MTDRPDDPSGPSRALTGTGPSRAPTGTGPSRALTGTGPSRALTGTGPSRALTGTEAKRLHRGWRRRTTARLALLLDGVQTPYNVGAIVRTAAAERIEEVWAVDPTCSLAHPKVAKTALGTQRYLTWHHVEGQAAAVEAVRAAGYRLVGVELTGDAEPLFDLELDGDVCLAVGHEDRGLSAAVLQACDAIGYVPMAGKVGSLNVAHATAIACYEARRQHWTSTTD